MGKKSSAVYNINYNIVWFPKFRKLTLVDKVKGFQTKGYKILEARVMSNHILHCNILLCTLYNEQ
jgi:REP element-mobilizing transposase RayT